MKRGNIFLLANIVVIVICLVVRLHSNYPAWISIVPAVTIASAFFSVSDFFNTLSQPLNKKGDIYKEVTSEYKNDPLFDLNTNKKSEYGESILNALNTYSNEINRIERIADRFIQCASAFRIVSNALAFLSFTLFMCIIIFGQLASSLIEIQDILSVLAFAVILMSQYISAVFSDMIEKDTLSADDAKKGITEIKEVLLQYESRIGA